MTLLAIDPGETVGWAIFDGITKLEGGQTDWGVFPDMVADALGVGAGEPEDYSHGLTYVVDPPARNQFYGVTEIVIEDFVLYPEGVGDGPPGPFDQIITARVIGAIHWIATAAGVPVSYQGATIKSDALASAAAEDFARPLYENRHENDATMHGTYYAARKLAKGEGAEPREWGSK